MLKALGAEGPLIRNVYLIQIGVLAAAGRRHRPGHRRRRPADPRAVRQGQPAGPGPVRRLSLAPAQGRRVRPAGGRRLLAAPLARARATPPSALFRRELSGGCGFGPEIVGAVARRLGLAALAVITAPTTLAAAGLIGGAVVAFGLLWLLGLAAAWLAGSCGAWTRGAVRIGLANLAGPRSAARTASPGHRPGRRAAGRAWC